MKVALVHDWLTGMRGGEKCLEVFCEIFPDADIFTLLHVKGSVSPIIEKHSIRTSFIQNLPFSRSRYRHYLPLFPFAIEKFNFNGYDLILSSSHCVAKGIKVPVGVCHIAYLFTPMRYVWDQYSSYFGKNRAGLATRLAMKIIRPWLQRWDVKSNKGIYEMIAISEHVKKRIKKFYNRNAEVIYPPVDLTGSVASKTDRGFYLIVSAFAPYKKIDLAIQAFNRLKMPLKIIGNGQDSLKLKKLAGPFIEFLDWRPESEIHEAYANCRALIFPGEEDFGIVPLEAMAFGKPVIAFGKGGVCETVNPINGINFSDGPVKGFPGGVFFYKETPESLIEAVSYFEKHRNQFDPFRIKDQVMPFDRIHFKDKIERKIKVKYGEYLKRFKGEVSNVE
jgi:glycosyltransferase involved in cell wall biosynthesis